METKLVEIIDLLEKDLKGIDAAVKHITKSQEAAQSVVDSNQEYSEDISKHMKELQQEVEKFLESIHDDSTGIIKRWRHLSDELKGLNDRLITIMEFFEKNNLAEQLENIDNSIHEQSNKIEESTQQLINLNQKMEERRKENKFLQIMLFLILGITLTGLFLGIVWVII